jgi:energy-coupling factor transport system ATP-binding protein
MEDYFIKTEHLSCNYKDENGREAPALIDINLNIKKGEYIAIIGRNGSGKSTLAKLLNMILDPVSGRIFIDGKEITSGNLTDSEILDIRRKVGMVFQNPDNQLVATIVEEDIAFGPENLGIPAPEIRRRVDEALEAVGMKGYERHEPHRLSGGQKQRIAIAGVLAMNPECIILDESTAMLDPRGRTEVMNIVEKLNRERGITVIMITHYMNEAVRADRVIILNDGRLLRDCTPKELFSQPDFLRRYGLDVPQSVELVDELRRHGVKIGGVPITPDECASEIFRYLSDKVVS